jgi:hypothetical protein
MIVGYILSGVLLGAHLGCVHVERVQFGPDSFWPVTGDAAHNPPEDQDLSTSRPASVPSWSESYINRIIQEH